MCKEFREMEEGMCHCQLYVKTRMKVFRDDRSDKVLLIEKGDLDNSIASKLRGHHVSFITGEKGAALFNLAVLNYANPMPPALYNLKCRAIQERAYVHPGWDYLKYPAVELEVCYSNLTSNKMYNEELDEDGYPILVFVGRCNSL